MGNLEMVILKDFVVIKLGISVKCIVDLGIKQWIDISLEYF
jgi:hypothetical protein